MSVFGKMTGMKRDTIFGKYVINNMEQLTYISIAVFFIPLIILILTYDIRSGNSMDDLPGIYSLLFVWYFIAVGLMGIFSNGNRLGQILEIFLCLPFVGSLLVAYFIFRIFTNKDKHPDITEDKLPLHQRKIKLKRLKKKIKKGKIFG